MFIAPSSFGDVLSTSRPDCETSENGDGSGFVYREAARMPRSCRRSEETESERERLLRINHERTALIECD